MQTMNWSAMSQKLVHLRPKSELHWLMWSVQAKQSTV